MRVTAFEGQILAIDTDTYAGNFEREMCAYITGRVGECDVGAEYASMFDSECPDQASTMDRLVVSVPDEHGCHRPASIFPTPGFWNDGMGNEWPDDDWGKPHTVEAYQKAVREYEEQHPGSFGDEERKPGRHLSYMSVAIFLSERPSAEVLALMLQRARAFLDIFPTVQEWNSRFKITGFRLVQERTEIEELASFPAT